MIEIKFDEGIAKDITAGEVFGKIKTRHGSQVRLIHFGAKGDFPIVGLIDLGGKEMAKQWTRDGKRDTRDYVTTVNDLVIEVEGGEV